MRLSHETINSIGVVIAMALSIGVLFESRGPVQIIAGGDTIYPTDKNEEIVRVVEGGSAWVTSTHSGELRILNSSNRKAYVSFGVQAIDECYPQVDNYIRPTNFLPDDRPNWEHPDAFVERSKDSSWAAAIEPEEVVKALWEITVVRRPEVHGIICLAISTRFSDGEKFNRYFRIGGYQNPYYDPDGQIEIDSIDLSEDEIDFIRVAGGPRDAGDLGPPGYLYFLAPRQGCLVLFGFEKCWSGQWTELDEPFG